MPFFCLLSALRPTQVARSQTKSQEITVFVNLDEMAIGDYPPEYNQKVHGPYDPARYYGKPDTAFGEVKIGELGGWLGRRNKSPRAVVQCISRAWWRFQHKYMLPKRSTAAPLYQITFGLCTVFYIMNYSKIKNHINYKYH